METRGTGDIVGLLEILEDLGKPVDLAKLDDSLDEERATFMNLLEDTEALGLVHIVRGDIGLTDLGRSFMSSDIDGRRKIILNQIRNVEPFHSLINLVFSSGKKEISKEDLEVFIEDNFPSDDNEITFGIIVNWGRYSKLLDYDSDGETITFNV
ncbi:MAG: AAA-associated domain-containing protein [Candidatus Thermoplasmatota archaeon]|nr:AAA-associated domain-containing protein [Candidatus Thermoplasmatota archaeon]MCL5438312.1 AAA-associated domain-containing protein [Candidatus Thermoplasmatota archaeon]